MADQYNRPRLPIRAPSRYHPGFVSLSGNAMTHALHTLLHVSRIPIRWGDMDAYGHVNNTVYFRYAEQNRVEWFEAQGLGVGTSDEGPVIVNAACTFLLPMTYPGMVEVRMYGGQLGRSSFMTTFEMRIEGDERLYAEGHSKVVWINTATGKSAPLPDDLRRLILGEA